MAARDTSIDFARAVCLPAVVLLHVIQMGVVVDHGRPVVVNALDNVEWFAWLTWAVLIMPVFFFAGGFASLDSWRRLRDRHPNGAAAEWVRHRTLRLAAPLPLLFVAMTVVMALAWLLVPDSRFVSTLGIRLGQPLWFLVVYLGVTALVPVMARLHEVARWRTLGVLAGGSALATAPTIVHHFAPALPLDVPLALAGVLGWASVWLFTQQLGFLLADGVLDRCSRGRLVAIAAACYALMVALLPLGLSHDILDNLNPPTLMILLLAVAQLCIFRLLQPPLRMLMAHRRAYVAIGMLGIFGMTIYLWHTVALGLVTAATTALGFIPEPLRSGCWWATRPVPLIAVALLIAGFCTFVPRVDARWQLRASAARLSIALTALVLAAASAGLPLALGYWPLAIPAGCAVLATCACLLAGRFSRLPNA